MKRIAVFTLLALSPLMSACALMGGFLPEQPAVVAEGQIEPIHAAAIAQDQAVFWVSSNGCTRKDDLAVVVRRSGSASVITLRRIKEDRCEAVQPQGVEMRWSFDELGLEPGARVTVENPYQVTPSI
jgi:hypothetical protein